MKASSIQARVIGVGRGDEVEASGLAQVRGERESVRNAMIAKQRGK